MRGAALAYAVRGWPVLPLRGKLPLAAHGLHDASTDAAVVKDWWRRWPDANVGVRTGAGLAVLDVDGDDGADALHELEREHGALPATVEALTGGGGRHVWFSSVEPVRSSAGRLGVGLDVRGDGGYVVVPPSVHESGREYEWEVSGDPFDGVELATLPAWLLAKLRDDRRNGSAPPVGDAIPTRERNATLTSLAGTMRRRGMGEEEMCGALKVTNATRCKPPLDEREVMRIARSVANYAPEQDDEQDPEMPSADPGPATSWAPRELGPVLDGERVDQSPVLLARTDGVRLLYAGKLHDFSGEPESCKGWLALHAAVECLKAGERVAYFDFEDTEATAVERLLALGADPEAIRTRFAYVRPDEPLGAQARRDLEAALSPAPVLVVVDGVTEALALHGLDLERNSDVAKWLELLPRPLARTGAAVALLDHVTKDREARGRYAIGAQHKLAGVDVAYRPAVVEPFGRGKEGLVRLAVAKDRPGHVRQHAAAGRVADVRLRSHAGGAVTVVLEPPDSAPAFRPTVLMERLSRAVEERPGLTKKELRAAVGGSSDAKDLALQLLVAEGFVRVEREGQAHCHHSVRSYRDEGDE